MHGNMSHMIAHYTKYEKFTVKGFQIFKLLFSKTTYYFVQCYFHFSLSTNEAAQ